MNLREEHLDGGFIYRAPGDFQAVTTDSLLLSEFANIGGGPVCDLCCGCGLVSVLLARKHPQCRFTGVDCDPRATSFYQKNGEENGFFFSALCADVSAAPTLLPAGQFAAVVANPPYFAPNTGKLSPSVERRTARQGDGFSLDALVHTAAVLLKNGGRFSFCIRPERLAEAFFHIREEGLEPKLLCLAAAKPDKAPFLAMICAHKQAASGLRVLPTRYVSQP